MRRWNGWGDDSIEAPLPESASHYLKDFVGEGVQQPDASLDQVLASIPPSRIKDHPSISTDPEMRLRHARGHSLPDWIALRSGQIGTFPDGAAFPTSSHDLQDLFAFARQRGAYLIPYGGGTSVVGHINPLPSEKSTLTLDLSHMNHLTDLDETSRLATFEAGVRGPDLESQLNARGLTLGHFPQSFEYSTLGGWIATRSSGQQSYHYGRIEDHFAGGHLETPCGPMDLLPHPASAAGPDLRHWILGSEGRLGVITHAIVRVRPLPEFERFYGVFFKDWISGCQAVRRVAQEEIPLSMLRLSDAQETATTLILSGQEQMVNLADRALSTLGYRQERCLLVFGITGSRRQTSRARAQASSIFRSLGGFPALGVIGEIWRKSRFRSPYLRNTLWEKGYAVDTLETAVPWSTVQTLYGEIIEAMRSSSEKQGEHLLVFAHLSHLYRDGASIYVTFIFRRAQDPEKILQHWRSLKETASRIIVKHHGTISHQHGVGLDHAPYLPAEKGPLGMALLNAAKDAMDPEGLLNPGKLLESSSLGSNGRIGRKQPR
jgi:alkyldihydroxyacetonephosphate synthase